MTVIERCPTVLTYDDGLVRFSVTCSLDVGHSGRHRGTAVIDFAGLEVPPATGSAPSSTRPPISTR